MVWSHCDFWDNFEAIQIDYFILTALASANSWLHLRSISVNFNEKLNNNVNFFFLKKCFLNLMEMIIIKCLPLKQSLMWRCTFHNIIIFLHINFNKKSPSFYLLFCPFLSLTPSNFLHLPLLTVLKSHCPPAASTKLI